MYIGLQVKYPLFLSILFKIEFLEFFGENSNIKFNENPSSGRRVFPCGQTDGRTDMTKLIVAFRNFAKACKNVRIVYVLKNEEVKGKA